MFEGKEEYLSSPGDCGGREEAVTAKKKGIAFSGSHEISSLNYKSWVGFVNFITIEESYCFTEKKIETNFYNTISWRNPSLSPPDNL